MNRSPRKNIPAADVVAYLDKHAIVDRDSDGVRRSYINNVWVDSTYKRIIRRWRHGHVRSIRPATVRILLDHFKLENPWDQQ